jgi:hypothetical protein
MCLSAVAGVGAIAGALPETVAASLLDLGRPTWPVFQAPIAGHVKGWIDHTPSLAGDAPIITRLDGTRDKPKAEFLRAW